MVNFGIIDDGVLRQWKVHVYEPDVDPGGFEGVFTVTARTQDDARQLALAEARNQWPNHHALAVYSAEPLNVTIVRD